MKKQLTALLVIVVLFSSCTVIKTTCPSTDPQFWYKQAHVKPHYYKR